MVICLAGLSFYSAFSHSLGRWYSVVFQAPDLVLCEGPKLVPSKPSEEVLSVLSPTDKLVVQEAEVTSCCLARVDSGIES